MKIVHMESIRMLKERATLADTYRFFDFDFSVRSDSSAVLGVFKDIFKRFLVNGHGAEQSYYVLNGKKASGKSRVVVDDRVYTIDDPGDVAGYAYMKIMDSALSKVLSHYLIHAAALSFNDKGIILPANSGSGKTTLTLELIKRGFNLLSDDIAAISKADYLLYPFLKGIGMLPSTLELCPEAELDSLSSLPMIGGGEKRLLDIGDLYPERIGKPCKVKYVIFLGPKPGIEGQRAAEDYLYVVLSRINDKLMSDIRGIKGVKDLSIYPSKTYPILRLSLKGKGPILFHVEEVCLRHKVVIFDSSDGREERLDFSVTPRLKKIPKSTAAIELLRKLRGVYHMGLLQESYKGKVTELLMEIGRFLEGVECFYLTPGRLKERADIICDILKDV